MGFVCGKAQTFKFEVWYDTACVHVTLMERSKKCFLSWYRNSCLSNGGGEELEDVLLCTMLLASNSSGMFFYVDVTHLVDLSKEWNTTVTIHFEGWPIRTPLLSEPICLICKDPRNCDRTLTLVSGAIYKISFLCKDLSRLRITAEKGISMAEVA